MNSKRLLVGLVLVVAALSWGIGQGLAQPPTVTQSRKSALAAVKQRQAKRVTNEMRRAAATRAAVTRLAAGVRTLATPTPGGTPNYFGPEPNWAYTPPISKFVDPLPGLYISGVSPQPLPGQQYIPVAVPDTTTYQGSDYYEIELGEYTEKMHSDLNPTTLRGYRQTNTTDPTVSQFSYLGPLIIAQKDRPVRVKFTNNLPTGAGGDLFLPVDTTVMGSGMGPLDMPGMPGMKEMYTQNRATIHLHGGLNPWVSDGTQHQWTVPAGEMTQYPKGASTQNVPDMPDPGDGSITFYFSNQQSARMMFYHDHAYGITRLNVYAGEAAGYLLQDPTELDLIARGIIPAEQIPLVIQDRTFVNPATVLTTDPTWPFPVNPALSNLWYPHVYMPNQNPNDLAGANPLGRWDYGPWFWPPWPVDNPPIVDPATGMVYPNVPNLSMTMEAFQDTPIVNGTPYPYLDVQPKPYRFRILNAANDRMWNLQLYIADPAAPTEVRMVPAVQGAAAFPPEWTVQTTGQPGDILDGRTGGVPDPALIGPSMIQIGNEGGFLPASAVWPNIPIGFNRNPKDITVGNVLEHNLFLGPAERADVIIDFSPYAGQTIILYNDAPAAVPAADSRLDYYTGDLDQTDIGGTVSTLPGFGPNTRTIMQIRVAAGTPVSFDKAALDAEFATDPVTGAPGVFARSQDPILVPQAPYNSAYNGSFPAGTTAYGRIQSTSLTFAPLDVTTPSKLSATSLTVPFTPKAIAEEFESTWGRMSGFLGVEVPFTNGMNQTTIFYTVIDPTTEIMNDSVTVAPVTLGDGTQIWKITHNGVDTHPIHFHLFNVQLINRVGWDGAVKPPEDYELGWKETLRMNPLEDCIVALRPVAPVLPFGLPDSIRPMNPTMPIGDPTGFKNVDPMGNPIVPPLTNQIVNFGWEYVWHCHILSHEEMDMMRPMIFNVARALPAAPVLTGAIGGSVHLNWTDGTPFDYLTWSPAATLGNPTNEVGFRIERAAHDAFGIPGPFSAIGSAIANATSYTDTTAAAGETYSYQAVAFNAAGDSPSNVVIVGSQIPAAPTNLLAAVSGPPLSVDLTWTDNASNENGFRVERAPVVGGVPGAFAPIGTVGPDVTTYSDTTAAAGTAYAYVVYAYNAYGDSVVSNTALVTTPPIPTAPSNLRATASAPGVAPISIALRWGDNSTNETGFLIERANGAGTFMQIAQVGPNVVNWTDTTVLPSATYSYRVRATNAAGNSPYTNTATATTGPNTLPAAPSNVQILATGNNYLTVGWNDNSNNETGFQIQRSTTAAGPWTLVTTTRPNVTQFRNNGLGRRATYYYQVRSVNGFGSSAWIPVPPVSGRTN